MLPLNTAESMTPLWVELINGFRVGILQLQLQLRSGSDVEIFLILAMVISRPINDTSISSRRKR